MALTPGALIEEYVRILTIIGELDHIGMTTACLSQDWLWTAPQITDVLRYGNEFSPQGWQGISQKYRSGFINSVLYGVGIPSS
jgi:hypothetical protein